jgi:hypothetical protein
MGGKTQTNPPRDEGDCVMDAFYLGKPTIPPKEGHYIVRGHSTRGSQNSKPFFTADFYIKKPFVFNRDWRNRFRIFDDLFFQSVRKFKKETEDQFLERCRNKIYQRSFYFHYKGEGWFFDNPYFDGKGFFISNPITSLLEEETE